MYAIKFSIKDYIIRFAIRNDITQYAITNDVIKNAITNDVIKKAFTNDVIKYAINIVNKIIYSCFQIRLRNSRSMIRACFIRGLEVGEIIPFPVWIIPFPVLKISFELLGSNEKHFGKEVF